MSKVFVLGAGASKGFRFNSPLMSELVTEIVNLCIRQMETRSNAFPVSEQFAEIVLFISHFYSSPLDPVTLSEQLNERYDASRRQVEILLHENRLPTLEDILSQIDFAIASDRPLSSYWSTDRLRKLRTSLVYAMSHVIRDRLDLRSQHDLSDDSRHQFWDKLQFSSVVSLNYDLVMDNLLVDFEGFADYGIPIRGLLDRADQRHSYSRFQDRHDASITLYKLHGSLNWLYCPRCRDMDVVQREKGVLSYVYGQTESRFSRCPICQVPYEPVIVTPTFLKSYENPLVRQLWDRAEVALEAANEIIFIGYSLPDADIIVRSMLTRALAANRLQKAALNDSTTYQITLVDYINSGDAESEARGLETRRRYEQLFGKIDDAHYLKGGLSQYIEMHCRPQKAK